MQCCPTGADVGGFFGNADSELLVRWNQLGTYYPFFRGHGHLETKRREPWLFGEDNTRRNRASLRERYALLPYLYTLFWESHTQGTPIMRPLWYEFPEVIEISPSAEKLLGVVTHALRTFQPTPTCAGKRIWLSAFYCPSIQPCSS